MIFRPAFFRLPASNPYPRTSHIAQINKKRNDGRKKSNNTRHLNIKYTAARRCDDGWIWWMDGWRRSRACFIYHYLLLPTGMHKQFLCLLNRWLCRARYTIPRNFRQMVLCVCAFAVCNIPLFAFDGEKQTDQCALTEYHREYTIIWWR